jgi:hypothetical protein
MHKEYVKKTKTLGQKLGWLVEEMGEAQAALGKTIRWGVASCNPELPVEQREMNGDWVLRELKDVEAAIKAVREDLLVEMQAIDGVDRSTAPASVAAPRR